MLRLETRKQVETRASAHAVVLLHEHENKCTEYHDGTNLFIPLQFWFNPQPALSIPICSITRNDNISNLQKRSGVPRMPGIYTKFLKTSAVNKLTDAALKKIEMFRADIPTIEVDITDNYALHLVCDILPMKPHTYPYNYWDPHAAECAPYRCQIYSVFVYRRVKYTELTEFQLLMLCDFTNIYRVNDATRCKLLSKMFGYVIKSRICDAGYICDIAQSISEYYGLEENSYDNTHFEAM